MKLISRFKIICTAAAFLAVGIQPFTAFAEWRQISGNKIIVSDKIESGEAGKPVTVNVFKPGTGDTPQKSDIVFHSQMLTTDGGKYEFVFEIFAGSGSYMLYLNENGKKSSETISFVKETPKSEGGGGSGGGGSKPTGSKSSGGSTGIAIAPNTKSEEQPEKINRDIFVDLDDAEWAKKEIVNLAERGIVSGRTENTFCPNQNMTREEFAKIIADAFLPEAEIVKLPFSDVSEGSWYYNYVAKAYSGKAISGKSDSLFGTGEYITREDMSVILYRILKDKLLNDGTEHLFADSADIAEYAKEAVSVFYQNKIISGMGDNCFMPKGYATRAQVAKIISGLMDIL